MGETLREAVLDGHNEIVGDLLESGEYVAVQDTSDDRTTLHVAALD